MERFLQSGYVIGNWFWFFIISESVLFEFQFGMVIEPVFDIDFVGLLVIVIDI